MLTKNELGSAERTDRPRSGKGLWLELGLWAAIVLGVLAAIAVTHWFPRH